MPKFRSKIETIKIWVKVKHGETWKCFLHNGRRLQFGDIVILFHILLIKIFNICISFCNNLSLY